MSKTSIVLSAALLLIICLQIQPTQQVLGVDVSQPTNTFSCMKGQGYQFAIVRAYLSYGALDPNAKQTLSNARNAGLIADIYHFPCVGKVSPATQAATVMNSLNGDFGTVWIDVESNPSSGCGWQSASTNCNFLKELVSAYQSRGAKVGIYASKYQWQSIFGGVSSCADFTSLPVWYAHYDGVASFSDWPSVSFGGWAKPSIKQFKGTTTLCGSGVDLNYY